MKILLFGFLVLSGWSAFSTYIYVCKIKGLCKDRETIELIDGKSNVVISKDTVSNSLVPFQAVKPENLVIYFAFDKAEFISDSNSDKYFTELNAYLGQDSLARLSITGHTDAFGSDEYNQALGYLRALSLKDYFQSKGLPSDKILLESKGEKEPSDNNNTTAGRANNRRTIITIKN
jgi:OOP family OmpA-OmpF porin